MNAATKFALRTLARRAVALEAGIVEIVAILKHSSPETAPELVAITGVGTDTATALLVAAGDNPERLRNEASFAHLCGVAPIDACSGKQERHRLNRGGDRHANSALWHIVITRMVCDQRTRDYMHADSTKAAPRKKPCDASSDTSHARSTTSSPRQHPAPDNPSEHQ